MMKFGGYGEFSDRYYLINQRGWWFKTYINVRFGLTPIIEEIRDFVKKEYKNADIWEICGSEKVKI